MITGDPGIGKSSNLMDLLIGIKKTDPTKRVLYISAEMDKVDLEEFLQFYPGLEEIDFLFLGEYLTDPESKFKPYIALQATLEKGWDIVVVDSLYETQSMIQEDLDINSFKKGERYMLDLMKKHNSGFNRLNSYTAFLVIQQKNKSGQYVGSKRLEHMTTAFLQLLWDPKEKGKRYAIFEKNRKGKEKVKLYYNMDAAKGIIYDEVRHTKELEFMEIMQQNNLLGLDSLETVDFEKLFAEKKGDDAHEN
jgi:predicted ATP-dependent serine protease